MLKINDPLWDRTGSEVMFVNWGDLVGIFVAEADNTSYTEVSIEDAHKIVVYLSNLISEHEDNR